MCEAVNKSSAATFTDIHQCYTAIDNINRTIELNPKLIPNPMWHKENFNFLRKQLIDKELQLLQNLNCQAFLPGNCESDGKGRVCEVTHHRFKGDQCTRKKLAKQFHNFLPLSNCNSFTNMQECNRIPNCKVTGLFHKKCVHKN